ncbi:hypothetical protein TWF718_005994 [Orbilia javanica]|uniref:Uncharacterized protein n=1 Tax=Orbilia javanica TaxID=47235 RepID=A0AAN8N2G2_9PEZI
MATAAYITANQFPMMGQPTMAYEVDPMTQQAYHPAAAGYVPTTAHPQQQVFLTSGQPVQAVVTGPGPAVFPQMRFQNPVNPNPAGVYMHLPYAGDLHAPPAYSDIDPSRFQPASRSRRSSFSVSFAAAGGQFGFPNNQMNPMGNQGDYAYVDSCLLCRANHPGPHPHGPGMNMHDMPPMSPHRQVPMDDTMSNSSKMRSNYSYEGPACDPMDWNPNFRNPRRDSSWGYRPSGPDARPRSSSRGRPSGLNGMPYNSGAIHVSEVSDDENTEDETSSTRAGRMTSYGNRGHVRRSTSRGPHAPRPPSRSRSSRMSTSGNNNYL